MKFYYSNNIGNSGVFYEKCLAKAIYTASNIEADLYLIPNNLKKKDIENIYDNRTGKLVYSPSEGDEFNEYLLQEFGYCISDGDKYREIKEIKTGKVIKCDWSKVKQLIKKK